MSIQFLDCTLRDGAHVNGGNFGKEHIVNVVNGLSAASADIVEIGFLKNVTYDEDITSYPTIEQANEMLSNCTCNKETRYAVMARADVYDITKLSECKGPISLIRIAFYYDYLNEAIKYANKVKDLGYDFTLNLVNTPGNSIEDLKKVVKYANELVPYAVMIVDTFGVLDSKRMTEIANFYNNELKSDIKLGLHVHENMSQSFLLAQQFIDLIGNKRDVIIDGSLMGMGRAPGNLCSELICNYLNDKCKRHFDINKIMGTIWKDIHPIKVNHKWGYSPEYFISAKYRVHRSYAEYLSDREIEYDLIDKILSKIDEQHSEKYDENYLLKIMNE